MRIKVACLAWFFLGLTALAQSGLPPTHSILIAPPPGTVGFKGTLGTDGQFIVGRTSADPIFRTMSGDCTLTTSGVVSCPIAPLAPETTKCNPTLVIAAGQDCSGGPLITARTYGVSMSAQSVATATCVATSASVALGGGGAIDFANGQGIALEHCGATFTGSAPTGLAVVAEQSPGGATTYAYKIACVDQNGGVGAATAAVTIANGAETLGTVVQTSRLRAYNQVTWTQNAGCVAEAVWRSQNGGSYSLVMVMSIAGFVNFNDTGFATVTTMPWIPATPPSSALNDRFVSTISSGGGTATVTLGAPVTNSASSVLARHDDTAALTAYFSAQSESVIPAGTINIEGITAPSGMVSIRGAGAGASIIQNWSSQTAALTLHAMASGFVFSDITANSLSTDADGVNLTGTTNPIVNNSIFGGMIAFHATSNTGLKLRGNTISQFGLYGIQDQSGSQDIVTDNLIKAGLFYFQGQALTASSPSEIMISNNKIEGGSFFGIIVGGANSNIVSILGNSISGTAAEGIHLSDGVAFFNVEDNNITYPGFGQLDYCISVADDSSVAAIGYGIIDGNYLFGCGESGINVTSVADAVARIQISNNSIYDVNNDHPANGCAVSLQGSQVASVYVFGNLFKDDFGLNKFDVCNSTGSNNQVGTNYGDIGTNGMYSMTGTGDLIFGDGVPTTFANLSACNAAASGLRNTVTNSNTNTWGAAIAGGGANVVQGFCNGSSWTVIGK